MDYHGRRIDHHSFCWSAQLWWLKRTKFHIHETGIHWESCPCQGISAMGHASNNICQFFVVLEVSTHHSNVVQQCPSINLVIVLFVSRLASAWWLILDPLVMLGGWMCGLRSTMLNHVNMRPPAELGMGWDFTPGPSPSDRALPRWLDEFHPMQSVQSGSLAVQVPRGVEAPQPRSWFSLGTTGNCQLILDRKWYEIDGYARIQECGFWYMYI